MLNRDFEDEVWSRSVFQLARNPIGYFGKMNSTLGSVVPLTMFSCDNSCFNLKDLSSTIHGWVSYKYPSANAHIWALDILLSPECCEWQVTVSWSKYGVHLTTARVHSPKRRILTTKHQAPSTIPSSNHFFLILVLAVFNWRDREDWMVYVVSTPHLS